jgi:hypothetical protein
VSSLTATAVAVMPGDAVDPRLASLLSLLASGTPGGQIPLRTAPWLNPQELVSIEAVAVKHPSSQHEPQLRAAGFEHVRRYRVRPSFANIRWLFPEGAAGQRALDEYVPQTASGTLLKLWTRATLWSDGDTLLLATRQEPVLERELSLRLQQPLRMAFSLGTPGAYNKTTATVLNQAENVLGFAKLAALPAAAVATLHEENILRSLAAYPELRAQVPEVLASFTLGGAQVLMTSAGPNCRAASQFNSSHESFLRKLAQRTTHPVRFSASTMWHNLRTTLAKVWQHMTSAWRTRVQQALAELQKHLGSVVLPMRLAHRDFVPWNTRQLSEPDLYVFDWEFAREQYTPLYDFFHFRFMTQVCLRKRPLTPADIQAMLKSAGPSVKYSGLWFLAYLTDLSLFYLDGLYARGGEDEGEVLEHASRLLDRRESWIS